MLHCRYAYVPGDTRVERQRVADGGQDLTRHILSLTEGEFLTSWCRDTPSPHILYNAGLRGEVQASDIKQLLCPSTLSLGLLMHLLCSHFPPTQSLVAVVDEGIMNTIYTRSWDEAYYNSDDMAPLWIQP